MILEQVVVVVSRTMELNEWVCVKCWYERMYVGKREASLTRHLMNGRQHQDKKAIKGGMREKRKL